MVQGRSATDLLDAFTGGGAGKAGVQRRAVQMEETADSEAEVSDGGELEATDSDFDEYASLADVMGESWEALRDQALDALWDAHFEVHVNLAEISARDAGAAAEIEADVAAGEALADGSLAFEEALLDTAWWTTEGDLVYDEVLADDLDQMVRDVDTYRCLFEAHDELWSIVLAIPWVERLAEILQAYVDQLKSFGEMAAGAVEANAWLEAFYAEHKEEFDEACLKAGVDVVAMGLGIGAAMCLTGPVGIAAGVTIAVGGLVAKLAIEGELGRVAALKTGFNGVNLTRAAMDHGKDIASVSDDMAAGLKFLGPAMNAMSLVIDGTEAVTERELYSLALAQMQSAERHIAATAAAWEAVQPMIQTAEPLLDGLEKAIGEAGPRIESLRAEIVQIRGQLGS